MKYEKPVCEVVKCAPNAVVCDSNVGQIDGLDGIVYNDDDIWE